MDGPASGVAGFPVGVVDEAGGTKTELEEATGGSDAVVG